MPTLAAFAATAILAALAVFQGALAAGAPIGQFAWGGAHTRLPIALRIGSAVSIGLYALFAVVLLDRAAVISVLPGAVSAVGAWVLFGYFVIGTGMNGISRSRAERMTMTPCCLVLAALTLAVALA
ncbi:hypothetical protein [Microterricola pindariensis]|uniref:Integral membrane protein n=1 Tax=Microterricola pindariensis TaxID=478010 RepID=A0ABX5ATW2_9MICO|nr:hypothetical protein [Microterricola pindariensis]PPL15877.1 hypothetical protein GY24_13630 [Microterricola pindariensis]